MQHKLLVPYQCSTCSPDSDRLEYVSKVSPYAHIDKTYSGNSALRSSTGHHGGRGCGNYSIVTLSRSRVGGERI